MFDLTARPEPDFRPAHYARRHLLRRHAAVHFEQQRRCTGLLRMERAGPGDGRAPGGRVRAWPRARQGRSRRPKGRKNFQTYSVCVCVFVFWGGEFWGLREERVRRGGGLGVRLDPTPAARAQWMRNFGFQAVQDEEGKEHLEWSSNLAA